MKGVLTDPIGKWLAAGALGAERQDLRGGDAFLSDCWGPTLSAVDVAELTARSERGIRKLAAAAMRRHEPFEPTAPILRSGDHGEPLRHPRSGATFAVVRSPESSTRGRPRSRSGEHGWEFRQAGPWLEYVAVPSWLEADNHGPGIPLPTGLVQLS